MRALDPARDVGLRLLLPSRMKSHPHASNGAPRRRKSHLRLHRSESPPDLAPRAASVGRGGPSALVETLLVTEPTVHDMTAAYVCASAAAWIYSEKPGSVVESELARIGLEDNYSYEISVHNDGMLVASTAVITQSACGRVCILTYRGTEPRNLVNFMTDFDASPVEIPMRGVTDDRDPPILHGGWHRNVRATWDLVARGLERAFVGRPANPKYDDALAPMEALFVTGHSLGAAMAAIASVRLAGTRVRGRDFRSKLRGIYTYGQPMLGNHALASACSSDPLLANGVFRHIHGNDIAARIPPRDYGHYEHFGREFRAKEGATWKESKTFVKQCPDMTRSVFVIPLLDGLARQVPALRDFVHFNYSFYDHCPRFYVEASVPSGTAADFHDAPTESLLDDGLDGSPLRRHVRP